MRSFTPEQFAAFNAAGRHMRGRVDFHFASGKISIVNTDNLISFNITQRLTGTQNTPYDACCADDASIQVYTKYTGIWKGKQVVDEPIFDAYMNHEIIDGLQIDIYAGALQDDNEWTPWIPLGRFYLTSCKAAADRITATIYADDKLAQIFGRHLPRLPVYKQKTFGWFLDKFMQQYELPVIWETAASTEKIKYAFMCQTSKETIQQLVASSASVAHVHVADDGKEELRVLSFDSFEEVVPTTIIDVANSSPEDTLVYKAITYDKNTLRSNPSVQLTWYSASAAAPGSAFQYRTENMDDFVQGTDAYVYKVSRAALSQTPLLSPEYTSTISAFVEGNVDAVFRDLRSAQYTVTGNITTEEVITGDKPYHTELYARRVVLTAQQLPADEPDKELQVLDTPVAASLKYVQYRTMASRRLAVLSSWSRVPVPLVTLETPGNPYIELGDHLYVDSQVNYIRDFTGVVWTKQIKYVGGAYSETIGLVDKDAFMGRVEVFDIAAQQRPDHTTVEWLWIVGKQGKKYGVWKVQPESADDQSSWQYVGALPAFTAAAITFDGDWVLSENNEYYSLFTADTPWIATVRDSTLFVRNGVSGADTELDTNVRFVAAERGYYPRDFGELDSDQGVIVAYTTTAETAFYRTFAITAAGKQWMAADQVGTEVTGITAIQVHRLNDYCIGIAITGDTCEWNITSRVYSQMAFRPEHFKVPAPAPVPILCVGIRLDSVAELPLPVLTWEINSAKTVVTITSDSDIYCSAVDKLKAAFSGTVNMPVISSVQVSARHIVVYFASKALATFTITLAQTHVLATDIRDAYHGGGKQRVQTTSHEFEIYESADYAEHFTVPAPTLANIAPQIYPVYTETHDTFSEHFVLPAPTLTQIEPEIRDARVTVTASMSEHFSVPAPTLVSIIGQIEGVNIEPI